MSSHEPNAYDEAAREVVELANRIADDNEEADLWDVADGLLSGAIHYWLYSRQPCSDPRCEDCTAINTAEQRVAELMRLAQQLAKESDYYHTANDANVGRA
jgi:hypothetical protein